MDTGEQRFIERGADKGKDIAVFTSGGDSEVDPVEIIGKNIRAPCSNFAEAGINGTLLSNIQKLGYEHLTAIQKNAIPTIFAARDTMICAQTGSGKTSAFLITMVHKIMLDRAHLAAGSPNCLFLCPTPELTYNELIKLSVNCGVVSRCISDKQYQKGYLRSYFNVLVASPEALLRCVQKNTISLENIRYIVLDGLDGLLFYSKLSLELSLIDNKMVSLTECQVLMSGTSYSETMEKFPNPGTVVDDQDISNSNIDLLPY